MLYRICVFLEAKMIRDDTTVRAKEATEKDLLVVHTKGYLNTLKVITEQTSHQIQ